MSIERKIFIYPIPLDDINPDALSRYVVSGLEIGETLDSLISDWSEFASHNESYVVTDAIGEQTYDNEYRGIIEMDKTHKHVLEHFIPNTLHPYLEDGFSIEKIYPRGNSTCFVLWRVRWIP